MKKLSILGIFLSIIAMADQTELEKMKSIRALIDRIYETEKHSPGNLAMLNKEFQSQLIKESMIPNTRSYDINVYSSKQQALNNVFWFIRQSKVYKPDTYLEREQLHGAANWSKLFDMKAISNLITNAAQLGAIREHEQKGSKAWFEPSNTSTTQAAEPGH